MPAHPVAQALIHLAGRPIAAPSANRSGEVSPTLASHVQDSLGDAVSHILDDGPCEKGLESTVLRVLPGGAQLLRPGAVTRDQIEVITGPLLHDDAPARPDCLTGADGEPLRTSLWPAIKCRTCRS